MISNPINYDQQPFTYEGGKTLYHISPSDSNIEGYESWRAFNLVFFANDKIHAEDVLSRMLKHAKKCLTIKIKKNVAEQDVHSIYDNKLKQIEHLLKNIDKFKFVLAPTNQFYKVGWADNDEA